MSPVLSPDLVWGLVARGVALVYFISFASLTHQVLPAAGSGGYYRLDGRLAAIRRDFPSWRRFFYFPTLSWIRSGDFTLAAFPWLGLVASGAVLAGGPQTPWAFVACYALYLSIDRALVLIFPWDSMLFEAGFFAMFLPALRTLPALSAVGAPIPALAWVYRLLLFRVLLGFGKFKFVGSTSDDVGYLKGFLVNQPLPSLLGWLAQKLPLPVLKAALVLMFVVEIPVPFTVFAPGPVSVAGALAIDAFMMVIWASGTFGYFSLVMIVVSLSWFDSATAQAFSLREFFTGREHILLKAVIFAHTVGALISFPLNTYCSMTWLTWSIWRRVRSPAVRGALAFYRSLHPFRWLHAYGVFPPHPTPPVKFVPVMEVTWDGSAWHTLEHHFSPTTERSRPQFCAPYHARVDQSLIYDVFGMSDATIFRNLVGWWEPYGHGHAGGSLMMMRRTLEGFLPPLVFKRHSIQRSGAPRAIRVRTYMLEPTPVREAFATGRWWKRTLVGPHTGPLRFEDGFWDEIEPHPETWHFDDLVWLRRSALGPLLERARGGESPHALVLAGAEGISASDVERFWSDFLPTVALRDRRDWRGMRAFVTELRAKYGRPLLYRFERIAGRYGAFLLARLEPLFNDQGISPVFGKVRASLDVSTYYKLGLLTHHIVGTGRAAYDGVFASPHTASAHLPDMTLQTGMHLLALFRYEIYAAQAKRLRLMHRWLEHGGRTPLSDAAEKKRQEGEATARRILSVIEVGEFLRSQFMGEEDVTDVAEAWPAFALSSEKVLERTDVPATPEGAA